MNKIDNPAATIFEKTAIYKEINRYSKYYKHFKFRSKGELALSYYVIDAFTDTKFGGNPAGVVINENLDEEFMQKFAEEVRFSETAFIKKIDSKNFDIKFFTPTAYVELCGHATIASFQALFDSGAIEDNNTYFMKTLAGTLAVEVN